MKKMILMAIMAIASAINVSANTTTPEQAIARKAAEVILSRAADAGWCTTKDKDELLQSGIVEEVAQKLVDSNFDMAKAVDRAAEIAVEQKWCQSKEVAKRYMRQQCERVRKNANLVEKVYIFLGI